MNRLITAAVAGLAVASASLGAAAAQPYNSGGYDHQSSRYDQQSGRYDRQSSRHGRHHGDWRTGGRVDRSDWNRGQRVDYRNARLRQPPRGYEYRRIDGDVVLAAVATGLILAILANN